MINVKVTLRDGETRTLEARPGLSLMEVIRDSGIDDILAICGGCCACATCHVYVDADAAGALPARGPDEADLLETSDNMRETSRLSCQIRIVEALDGLAVTIAPEE
ncbi:MAG: 2Fe-2S iron-sulfur cluster-binding protein [Caulobacterales bacterium]|uniref:2Fe-2S iron-sulfur cluster-binding protein n=1 Tax=Glycocaulis sp. TaxID=1969725 RepID=UPI003FA18E3A